MKFKLAKKRRGISLLPNLLTMAGLFCGFFAIVQAIQEHYTFSSWLIILATFFDFLDGSIARMTKTQSEFGFEFDSLSDMTTFCVAPAVLMYHWSLYDFGKFGIAACFLFMVCGALRLARFNTQAFGIEKFDFQGLPSPAAGGSLATCVIFFHHVFGYGKNPSLIVMTMTVALGLLMVSNVKYRSFKKINRASFLFLVCLAAGVFIISAQPEIMFFVVAMLYVGIGVAEWIWNSPKRIRNFKDLVLRVYNDRRERLLYDDEDEEDEEEQEQEPEISKENIFKLKGQ